MKPLKEFSIPFTGLKLGNHNFEFEINKSFFDVFEYSLVKDGNLNVKVDMEKQETMLILNFTIKGDIQLSCDTCLADFLSPIEIKERQIVKFGENDIIEDDLEIIVLNKNENTIDISSVLYEVINVSVPYIKNCEENGNQKCDQEMIEKLASLRIKEENKNIDPRWDALKNIQ
ncbi:MAG: DUF177 domain-containing protein [Sphingobacteriaceae bacterium]|nr:DUF177 domain-containing protein [Sphingobacteriaceae bacterium]